MKKGGKKINLTLVFSARALYSAIAILIVLIAGVGVFAIVDISQGYHSITQIQQPSGCLNGQFLQWDDTNKIWKCADASSTDPTVMAFAKSTTTLGSCPAGQSIRIINRNTGTVTCEVDTNTDTKATLAGLPSGSIAGYTTWNFNSDSCVTLVYPATSCSATSGTCFSGGAWRFIWESSTTHRGICTKN